VASGAKVSRRPKKKVSLSVSSNPTGETRAERIGSPLEEACFQRLRALLASMESVLVCYSGGVDSAFVLSVAHSVLGDRAVGMTAVSPSLPSFEREAAIAVAKQIGARHELVDSQEIERPGYVTNGPDRCFHCKSELYDIAEQKRREWGLGSVLNGTNLDDLGDYRPGLEAAKRANVRSVLVECGFRKIEVRRCAHAMGLAIWDKPASACLSSRIPYGTEVTRERLAQIGGLEAELRALGLRQVRVRWHALGTTSGDRALARIEVAREELALAFEARDAIATAGTRFGFAYITLDLQGYRTGSHNEVLAGRSLRVV
jgi:pyridinium-3,5-biscarboxylic acid mononucleotide sulfurtransferase